MKQADRAVVILLVVAVLLGSAATLLSLRAAKAPGQEHVPSIRGISREKAQEAGLSTKEASWYTRIENDEVECELCPRSCILRPGERGYCKVRVNFGGTLYLLVYGKVVAAHNDPIEKKPLFHFLPGERALSIATAGCNLACAFCQNWTISQVYPEDARALTTSPEEVVAEAEREGCKAIAYTYSEPTIFYEFMLDCAKLARQRGIKNLWVTAGYINPEPLRELARYLDAANVDLKGIRDEYYQKYCEGHVAPVKETIRILKEMGVHVEITNLVVPGGNDSEEDLTALARWVRENVGADAVLHFSRYFPMYKMESPAPTPVDTLLRARRIAREQGLHYVYVGNTPGEELENTYCPKCGRLLVRRQGFSVDWSSYGIDNGRCRYCGKVIYGLWK